jgi:uncharacterized protein
MTNAAPTAPTPLIWLIQARYWLAACWLLVMLVAAPWAAASDLPRATLTIRFFEVTAEVAATPADRARGLMGRQSLPVNHGMIFVFESAERQCFWMKNTPLPLSIAFIDDSGAIVNIADMQPFSEAPHCSARPVRYALEMEQGWFKKRGVLVGDTVAIPASLKSGR